MHLDNVMRLNGIDGGAKVNAVKPTVKTVNT